ncbi:MAG: thioesterase family protein [Phycisphaerae bacterium]
MLARSKDGGMMGGSSDVHEHEIRVRYAECDAMGFLHHAKYFEYIEEARTEALRARGIRYRDLEAEGVLFVVAKLSCRFFKPIAYDDVVTVQTSIERFTRTRIDHSYRLLCDGELKSEAATTLACIGRDGRPRVMPDHIWSIHQETKPRRRGRG